jgi:transposase
VVAGSLHRIERGQCRTPWRPARENIGLDLPQRESQLCILTDDGEVIERRIRTTPERLTAVLGPRAPARILLEASTESEWVARHLEALGHTVIVADPNYAPMYATRSARVTTDRRDARTLADALRLEAYRPAHRSADRHRHVRAELAVRDTLVRRSPLHRSCGRSCRRPHSPSIHRVL